MVPWTVLLTHASERADIPAEEVDDSPPYQPRKGLDPDDPVSIGAMVGPEAFTEVRYLAVERMRRALQRHPAGEADFGAQFGRGSGGLVKLYRTDDADLIVVALGSVLGTVKDAIDELRDDGVRVGALGITTFRRSLPRRCATRSATTTACGAWSCSSDRSRRAPAASSPRTSGRR